MLIFAPKTRTVYIRFVGTHKEYDEIKDIINGRSMQRCVLLLFYADFLLVSKFFMHFCFHFHFNLFKPLYTKGLKAVEENYFSSTLLPLRYITTECQSPYD